MLRKKSCAYILILAAAIAVLGIGCTPDANTENDDSSMAGTDSVVLPAASVNYGIPNSRERFEIQKALISDKLEKALLPAMRNHGIDMWIVLDRENNPDPLHVELGGRFSGVRAAYIFFDNGGETPEKIYYGSHEQPANSVISQIWILGSYLFEKGIYSKNTLINSQFSCFLMYFSIFGYQGIHPSTMNFAKDRGVYVIICGVVIFRS